MNLKTVFTLTKKEILSQIDTSSSSISFIVFLVFWQFLFFRNFFLIGEVSLRSLYDYLPWILLFFSSALTMGVFAQEKMEGTLELLLTHPVREIDVVISKFLGTFFLLSLSLLFAVPIAISISLFGPFDWGGFAGQLLSSLFLGACFISIGIFLSAFLNSQIATLLASSAVCFLFVVLGTDLITANIPLSLVPVFERLSILSHQTSMSRGVIDLRDVWYFIAFVGIFLSFTYLLLLKRKYGNRRDYFASFQIGIGLFIAIAIVSTILGSRIPGRIDITRDQKYSISPVTKESLGKLSDIVTITFYASSKLPSQLTPTVRETRDLLRDYVQMGRGNITVVTKDPSNNTEISREASARGVQEMQFNVIGNEEFQVKTGFVGIVVSYADSHEAIPVVKSTGDLEYQLTSLISKLTNKEKKVIAFLQGHGEKSLNQEYGEFSQELDRQFITKTITLDKDNPEVATDAAVLVVAGPTQSIDQSAQAAILRFLRSGKSAFFLLDGFDINLQSLSLTPNKNSFADFVNSFGVNVNSDVVYDLKSNETVRVGQGIMNVLLPYPFWVRAVPADNPLVQRISGVTFPWTSSLSVDQEKLEKQHIQLEQLFTSSPYAGTQTENIVLTPDKANFSRENISEKILAVLLSGRKSSDSDFSGSMAIVGDSDFLTDQFATNAPNNIVFGMSVISSLTSSDALSSIKAKESAPPRLVFRSSFDPVIIKYGNLSLGVIVPLSVVFVRILRRRSLRKEKYHTA